MAKPEKAFINVKVLKWARKRAHVSLETTANKFNKSTEEIEKWESGEEQPTYIQLEKLAYEVYKIPIATFYLPEIPELEEPETSFRSLPEEKLELLSREFIQIFRKAQLMQINLNKLTDGTNEKWRKAKPVLMDIFNEKNHSSICKNLRRTLGVSLEKQFGWDNNNEFENWRKVVQDAGIFVFKSPFRQDGISGFCIYDEKFPIIFINNSTTIKRQIFTLFHEFFHICLGLNSIEINEVNYSNSVNNKKFTEFLCNKLTGEFLVPENSLEVELLGIETPSSKKISDLAKKFSVSREVILRRCLDIKKISKSKYKEYLSEIKETYTKRSKPKKGNYYNNKIHYLGLDYLSLAFSNYYSNAISKEELADFLDMKTNNIDSIESVFISRFH